MLTIRTNVVEMLETGFTIEQIVQITGYTADYVKKIESDWRRQMKQK